MDNISKVILIYANGNATIHDVKENDDPFANLGKGAAWWDKLGPAQSFENEEDSEPSSLNDVFSSPWARFFTVGASEFEDSSVLDDEEFDDDEDYEDESEGFCVGNCSICTDASCTCSGNV